MPDKVCGPTAAFEAQRITAFHVVAVMQVYEHEQKKHRETEELRAEEAQVQQQEQRLRQVRHHLTFTLALTLHHTLIEYGCARTQRAQRYKCWPGGSAVAYT